MPVRGSSALTEVEQEWWVAKTGERYVRVQEAHPDERPSRADRRRWAREAKKQPAPPRKPREVSLQALIQVRAMIRQDLSR